MTDRQYSLINVGTGRPHDPRCMEYPDDHPGACYTTWVGPKPSKKKLDELVMVEDAPPTSTAFIVRCRRCDKELGAPGGLIFGPPSPANHCTKWHVCVKCFATLLDWLKTA